MGGAGRRQHLAVQQPVVEGGPGQLLAALSAPPPAAAPAAAWPSPWPPAELRLRYGLRPLTSAEQPLFPGLRLVRTVQKVRLTRPPAVVPAAQAGWVIWVAETYPGHYLVRLPGGAPLLAPYHALAWQAVSADTPATTPAGARAMAQEQQWQQTVRENLHRRLRLA